MYFCRTKTFGERFFRRAKSLGANRLLAAFLCLTGIANHAMADCTPVVSGLVGWWPGDGSAMDIVGTNHGSLQGGATAVSPGLVNASFNFDGTNGYVSIPDSPELRPTNFTIEAWVKLDALDTPGTANESVQFFVFKQNSRTNFFEGYWLGKSRATGVDTFTFGVCSAAGEFVPVRSGIIQTGLWYHVAAVRGSNYIQLYTNGVLSAQATVNFPQDYGALPLYFGSSGLPSYDRKPKGSLDEISLYNRALSAGEINAIYSAGAEGKCKTPNITGLPLLKIRSFGDNVVLTWPTNTPGFTLQSATNLVSAVWGTVSPSPIVVNGLNTVTNSAAGTKKFYRLIQ